MKTSRGASPVGARSQGSPPAPRDKVEHLLRLSEKTSRDLERFETELVAFKTRVIGEIDHLVERRAELTKRSYEQQEELLVLLGKHIDARPTTQRPRSK